MAKHEILTILSMPRELTEMMRRAVEKQEKIGNEIIEKQNDVNKDLINIINSISDQQTKIVDSLKVVDKAIRDLSIRVATLESGTKRGETFDTAGGT